MKGKSIHNFGYRVLGDLPSRYFPFSKTIQEILNKARFRISPIIYIGSMAYWAMIAAVIAAAVTLPVFTLLNFTFNLNFTMLQVVALTLGLGVGSGVLVTVVFIMYPRYVAGNIKIAIEKNIVYIINYMAVLAGAGVTTEDLFVSLAETGDTYMVADSAKSVVIDIEVLGRDVIGAIDQECKKTPSTLYSRILQGLVGTIRTGGNLSEYLKDTVEHQMEVRRRRLSRMVNQLNLAAEAYIVLCIAFPVILVTLLSMMGIFGGEIAGGMGPTEVMSLMTYIFFPLACIGVIILIDGMSSGW